MKRLIILLMVIMIGTLPVFAQDDTPLTTEELAMIDFVLASYENLFTQTSYTSTMQQSMIQTVTAGITTIHQEIKQNGTSEATINPEGGATDMYAKTEQHVTIDAGTAGTQEVDATFELILYGGEMFMRYEDVSQLPGIPEGWFNVQDIPTMQMIDMDEYTKLSGANALNVYPINEDTVAAIEELDPETIDGQEMRVFQITWDMEALAGNNAMSSILDAETFSQMMGMDADEYMRQFLLGSTYEQILWIGVKDNLPHRFETRMITDVTLEALMGSMEMQQEMTTAATFADFNTPIKIEPPTIGE